MEYVTVLNYKGHKIRVSNTPPRRWVVKDVRIANGITAAALPLPRYKEYLRTSNSDYYPAFNDEQIKSALLPLKHCHDFLRWAGLLPYEEAPTERIVEVAPQEKRIEIVPASDKDVQTFNFGGFSVRIVMKDEEPWFVAADVCKVLELEQVTRAVSGLDSDEVTTSKVTDSMGRKQEMLVVTESGLYSLILRSRKPEAKTFKRWVTHEVIPSIRKHGAYLTPEKVEEAILNPDTIIKLATELKAERQRRFESEKKVTFLAAKNEVLTEKAEVLEQISASDELLDMNTAAKRLGISLSPDKVMGEKQMFSMLRSLRILRDGGGVNSEGHNQPYQQYIDSGFFRVKYGKKYIDPYGREFGPSARTWVTPKGLVWLARRFWKEGVKMTNVDRATGCLFPVKEPVLN